MKKITIMVAILLAVLLSGCDGSDEGYSEKELENLGWSCSEDVCTFHLINSPIDQGVLESNKTAESREKYVAYNVATGQTWLATLKVIEFKAGYTINLYKSDEVVPYVLEKDRTVEYIERFTYNEENEKYISLYVNYTKSELEYIGIVADGSHTLDEMYQWFTIEEILDCEKEDLYMIGDETICEYTDRYKSSMFDLVPLP